MSGVACQYPAAEDFPDLIDPPEEYGHWRTASGWCRHPYCIEANAVVRLYRWANPEIVVEDHGGYVVTAELADA